MLPWVQLPFQFHSDHDQGWDPRVGLPRARQQWVGNREVAGDATPTQMFYAKQGIITEEMAFVAAREHMPAEFVRSEVSIFHVCTLACASKHTKGRAH